jgi:mutator protein MutT
VESPRLVAVAILASGSHVLLERRPDSGPLPGLWQFPGGKVEFGEHPWDALRRELREELGLRIARGTLFGVYSHVYDLAGSEVHYVLVAYRIPVSRKRIPDSERRQWVEVAELRKWPIVPGSRPVVADLARGGGHRFT